jgi:hypothetical protein
LEHLPQRFCICSPIGTLADIPMVAPPSQPRGGCVSTRHLSGAVFAGAK